MSDAEVIQGRLGWESGDITEAKPEELTPHPKNTKIYGDTEDIDDLNETFKESISEKGVLEPLVITDGKKIISGHRRWIAARDANLESIPVRYSDFDDELAEREALIEFNRQREKTPGQLVNEFEEMLAIEKERAKERNSKTAGDEPSKETFPDTKKGQARDKAAEKVNADVSGRTLEKGKKVKDKADDEDEPEPVREAAKEAWEGLQSGRESFTSAYQAVKTSENKVEKQQRREKNKHEFHAAVKTDNAVTIDHGDFTDILNTESESVDHIITDPPYNEDAIAEWEKLASIAVDVLKPGGLLAAYSGKYHLPAVYQALDSELKYFWQCIVVHGGGGARVWPRNIRTNYKPVLVFAKPPVEKLEALGHDVIDGAGAEKDAHEWQQATAESAELVDQLTEPNDLICDPMCGSGTTGVAALDQGRRVWLIDRDEEAVESAYRRCSDVI